uniref:Uncharacterized protein n=1 Tax=Molossus molossus TaxID=27622 RepID=A0A7J8HCF4_MOLMO|nr:hypothetical protein HJG59_011175 [Molossus molossus]
MPLRCSLYRSIIIDLKWPTEKLTLAVSQAMTMPKMANSESQKPHHLGALDWIARDGQLELTRIANHHLRQEQGLMLPCYSNDRFGQVGTVCKFPDLRQAQSPQGIISALKLKKKGDLWETVCMASVLQKSALPSPAPRQDISASLHTMFLHCFK